MRIKQLAIIALWTAITLLTGSVATAEPENSRPKVGDECDRASFTAYCEGDYLMRCFSGRVKGDDCGKKTTLERSYTCAEFMIAEEAECVEEPECSTENEKILREKTTSFGKKWTEFLRCERTKNGKMYYRLFSIDSGSDTYKVKDTHIKKVTKDVKAADTCTEENEIIETERTNENGRVQTRIFRCTKNPNGVLFYKLIKTSNKPNPEKKSKKITSKPSTTKKTKKNDVRPKDEQIDLPF